MESPAVPIHRDGAYEVLAQPECTRLIGSKPDFILTTGSAVNEDGIHVINARQK
jgi:hypothetical protein